MAYVYVADRSTCVDAKKPCDWARPPRYEEDVLAVADVFQKNSEDGSLVPELKGKIDMVLTRRPRPYAEEDLPFEVYVGRGDVVPVEKYRAEHPHPTYVDVRSRLRDLGVGPRGERAGDVVLLRTTVIAIPPISATISPRRTIRGTAAHRARTRRFHSSSPVEETRPPAFAASSISPSGNTHINKR